MKKIIMASQSPRRKELMEQAGYEIEVIPSDVEEIMTTKNPWEVVEELSYKKAEQVYEKIEDENVLVIGADTVVSVDGKILGKPKAENEAMEMLFMMQGRTHNVYTGVTFVYNNEEGKMCSHTFHEKTEVTFYSMTTQEIKEYVDKGEYKDKAGSYGIQGAAAIYIKKIDGDYNNVVGLPISRIYQEMKKLGLQGK